MIPPIQSQHSICKLQGIKSVGTKIIPSVIHSIDIFMWQQRKYFTNILFRLHTEEYLQEDDVKIFNLFSN